MGKGRGLVGWESRQTIERQGRGGDITTVTKSANGYGQAQKEIQAGSDSATYVSPREEFPNGFIQYFRDRPNVLRDLI